MPDNRKKNAGATMVLDNVTAQDRFMILMEWMLAMGQRHAEVLQPALIRIAYDRAHIQNLTFDAGDAAAKLGEVTSCLKSAFRGTDVIARQGINFWILIPFTQLDSVIEKVNQVIRTAPRNGLEIARSDVRVFPLRDHMAVGSRMQKDPQVFLDYLLSLPVSEGHDAPATPLKNTNERNPAQQG